MSSSYLISLINRLKEEYNNYYLLRKKLLSESIPQKIEIKKNEIAETEKIITRLNEEINININKYRQIESLKREINYEKKKQKELLEKSKKLSDFLEKGKKILINDILYYKKLPDYSNKKLKTAKISPLDLINFTLRISQQNQAPSDLDYFYKYLPNSLKDKPNMAILYNDYYMKNKNRFFHPYPDDYFGMKNTILRYDLSEKNRLLPPILDSNIPFKQNEKGELLSNRGKEIIFKYPAENPPPGIIFKYSKDPNILPSFFTGEEYKDYSHPTLDKDCIIKVCTCRTGFKDSKIITFKFIIDSNEVEKFEEKNPDTKAMPDYIIRPSVHIDSRGEKFEPLNSPSSGSPQRNTSRPGTSSYEPIYYNPDNDDDDGDDDEI